MNAKSVTPTSLSNHDIACRARQIWEQAGCVSGHELDHWLQAERELKQEAKDLEASLSASDSRRPAKDHPTGGEIAKTGLLGKPGLA
jgi:hypothetical protein